MTTPALDVQALQLLLTTGERLKAQNLIAYPNDPEKMILLANGTHTIIDAPRQPVKREHYVATVADFVEAHGKIIGESTAASPVWFSRGEVRVFTDDKLREDYIALIISASPQMKMLLAWSDAPVEVPHAAMVRLLRHDFAGCVSTGVLAAFRTLNWQTVSNTKRTIEQNKHSMDADVAQAVVAAAALPEEFKISIPLFSHSDFEGLTAALTVTVDMIFDRQAFRLQLLPGDYAKAEAVALEYVRDTLNSALPGVTLIAGEA